MRFLLALSLGLWLGHPAPAAVLRVPGTYATISAALLAARPGDVILVAPGTYKECVVWPQVDGICLIGVEGPARTVIDAEQKGRAVIFQAGLTRATVFEGFTVTGGWLSSTVACRGPGVYVTSSPTIRGNWITGNIGDGTGWNHGAGILVARGDPLIEGNLIRDNHLRSGSPSCGAGICLEGGTSATITANRILENTDGGAPGSFGGGIHVMATATARISDNIIARNRVSVLFGRGAGILVEAGAQASIVHNTIAANGDRSGYIQGGGVHYAGTSQGCIVNNVIVDNLAATGGGIYLDAAAPLLDFNDVWNNAGGDYANATPGPHSLSADPAFSAAPEFHLSASSPCVDAGDASVPGGVASRDVDGDPRRLDGNLDGYDAHVDLGADEYSVARLSVSAPPRLGTTIQFDIAGPGGAIWVLVVSAAPASAFLDPFGVLLIGPPFMTLGAGAVPGKHPCVLPGAPVLAGVTVHLQGFVGLTVPARTAGHLTNRLDLKFF